MARVSTTDLVPIATSQLALTRLDLAPAASTTIGRPADDVILFLREGTGVVEPGGATVGRGCALLVCAGEQVTLQAGPEGACADAFSVGAACDRHAPMGDRATVVDLEQAEHGRATGKRSFQVLFDGTNGSLRATLFAGHIPAGAAPWHYHLYDEIVCVLAGSGRLHLGGGHEPLGPGSAFRLAPREVHIVENTSATAPLSVLGLFTPAGSPSAAYLPDGIARYAGD